MKKLIPIISALLLSCNSGDNISFKKAYIINKDGKNILLCNINVFNRSLDTNSCKDSGASLLSGPINMSIYNSKAYISNYSSPLDNSLNSIITCKLNFDGSMSNCTKSNFIGYDTPIFIKTYNDFLYVPSYSSGSLFVYNLLSEANSPLYSYQFQNGLLAAVNIEFYNQKAYIALQLGDTGGAINSCDINQGALTNCITQLSFTNRVPLGMAINNNLLYLTDPSNNAVLKCSIDSSNNLSECSTTGSTTLFNYPYGISFYGNQAYIANRSESANSIVKCGLDINGNLANCQALTSKFLKGPTQILFN